MAGHLFSKDESKHQSYTFQDFKEAQKSQEFLKFVGESTKLKIFTTEFYGYAKSFVIQYDVKEEILKNIVVKIAAGSLDTDNSMRDDKLHNQCLKVSKFPEITLTIAKEVSLKNEGEGEVLAVMHIMDKSLTKSVKYKIQKVDLNTRVDFTSSFLISESGIEDPSIAIAKVRDEVLLSGTVVLKP